MTKGSLRGTGRPLNALVLLVVPLCIAIGLWGCGPAQPMPLQDSTEQEATTKAEATNKSTPPANEADGQDNANKQATAEQAATESDSKSTSDPELEFYDPGDYRLRQVVVLSRHSIRAPLSSAGSTLQKASSHEWIPWTANTSELTSRGGSLETMMGQYMRKWLESEELIPQNYQPEDGAVRFYANSKQRTLATAQYFSSGMLPVANVRIESHADYDTMDPVFTPAITFLSDAYEDAALDQIASEFGGNEGMQGVATNLADSYELIEDVVGYAESEGHESGELEDLDTTDTQVVLELGEEPAMSGSLKLACQLADALVLQYYEAPNATRAAFGQDLTNDQWALISQSKDAYGEILFTAPLVATNVAHPLLAEIGNELDASGRVFSFLCGHDSNIASVLSALGTEDYTLPGAIEAQTPIGCKLVFERWEDASGASFGRLRLLYQSVDQLRSGSMIGGMEAPQSVELSLEGMQKNEDGLYAYDDLRNRIADSVAAYDQLQLEYADAELAEAA